MNEKTCPTCHAPVPAHAPGGFCPACLLRDAGELPVAGQGSPSLAEIAEAFPQFEVLGLIGQGGMGFVYQVRQSDLDRIAALKILAPDLGRDPAFAERFARESRALGRLNHPNIVTIYEHGEGGGFFYLLMEYVDGVNLRQAMRAGRFTPEQALAIVPGICDALHAAHAQGVWHRDIKPENILLDPQGKVKIADFGIARIVGDPHRDFTLTHTRGALGSAAYMAPEQHENPRGVDHRADIYSLGVVIYEMLTGELPLGRFPAPSERAAVNARIDQIVFRTLAKERELRHQSAAEVKTEMQGASLTDAAPLPEKGQGKAPAENRFDKLPFGFLLASVAGYSYLPEVTGSKWALILSSILASCTILLGIFRWRTLAGRFAIIAAGLVLWAFHIRAESKRERDNFYQTLMSREKEASRKTTSPPSPSRRAIPAPAPKSTGPDGFGKQETNIETIVDWNIFLPANGSEPAMTRNLKGKLNSGSVSGYEYSSVAITAGDRDWLPVCMIVSKGGMNGQSRSTNGTTLKGTAVMAKRRIEFEIREPDKIVIGGKEEDLRQGRVFMCRPDGSVRQIALFPREFISANEIDGFAESIPKEDQNRMQHFTRMDGTQADARAAEQKSATQWTITEDFTPGQEARIVHLEGKLTPEKVWSGKRVGFTVHSGGSPVFMVVGEGYHTRNSQLSDGRELKGNFDIGQQFYYRINNGDEVTINDRIHDLSKGRVFLIRDDGSLRQIAMRPERIVVGDELEKFMSSLPPEK